MKECSNKNYINAVGYDLTTNPRTKLIPVYLLFIVPTGFLPHPIPLPLLPFRKYCIELKGYPFFDL